MDPTLTRALMSRILSRCFIGLRYVFVPMAVFLGLAMIGLAIKASAYVIQLFAGITSDSLGQAMHYALSVLDVTLVMSLMFLLMGYLLFNFVVGGDEAKSAIPPWGRSRFMPHDAHELKLQIAVTVLLIATIDLLGEFVELSDLHVDEIAAQSGRLWLMLGIYSALVVTAVVFTVFVRLTDARSRSDSDQD